jgi:nucleotide-binding universal stress UspA family protein
MADSAADSTSTPTLVAVAGSEPDAFWTAVRDLLPATGAIELFHVVDEGPRRELEMQLPRHPGLPRPPHLAVVQSEAEKRGTEAILGEAAARVGRQASTASATGRPEQEIELRAAEIGARLIIVAARTRPDPGPPGPHSVGHVARHIADHAPCPVLLVRLPRRR